MGPNPMTAIFIKREVWTWRQDMQREDAVKTPKKMLCDWSDASTCQNMPRIVSEHQKLEEARKDSPLDLLERAWPC